MKSDGDKRADRHKEHRQRAKDLFLARGLEGLPDHQVLELLLFYAIPRRDVKDTAYELLESFGSLSAVFHATFDQLLSVKGVGANTATLIRLIPALGARYLADRVDVGVQFVESWQFRELLEPCFYAARNEEFYVVCLDGSRRLLCCRNLGEGIVDQVGVSSRKVMETALACNASYVVLAHNHVDGMALPSPADRATTLHLKELLSKVGITLWDHYVFGDGEMVSFRESWLLS